MDMRLNRSLAPGLLSWERSVVVGGVAVPEARTRRWLRTG